MSHSLALVILVGSMGLLAGCQGTVPPAPDLPPPMLSSSGRNASTPSSLSAPSSSVLSNDPEPSAASGLEFTPRAPQDPSTATPELPTATPSPMPTETPTPTSTPGGVPLDALPAVKDLVERTNALRAQNGLPPYRWSDALAQAARRHSQDMANTRNISHTGSDGSKAKQRVLDTGYPALRVTENIYGGRTGVDNVWEFWSTDPDHRPSLVSTQYAEIGLAVVEGNQGWLFYTMDLGVPNAP